MIRSPLLAVMAAASMAGGCAAPIAEARTTPDAPPLPREVAADSAVENQRCSPRWGLLLPGVGQLCRGHTEEGSVLLGLTALELTAAAIAVDRYGFTLRESAVMVPVIGLQDLWLYAQEMILIEEGRALRKPFTPQDNMAELARAPFNPRVIGRPHVLGSILGATAAGVGIGYLLDDGDARPSGEDVNYFGRHLDPLVGYPAAGLTFGALYTHVALAEEAAFRGGVQSRLARKYGETTGWALASLYFGAVHVPNAFLFTEGDVRRDYLLIGVPFISAVGGLVGLNYRWADYSLTAPVAVHFWYNFLISAVELVRNPETSMLSASIRIPL